MYNVIGTSCFELSKENYIRAVKVYDFANCQVIETGVIVNDCAQELTTTQTKLIMRAVAQVLTNDINRYYIPSVKYGIAITQLADQLNLHFTQFEGEDITAISFENLLIGYVLCPQVVISECNAWQLVVKCQTILNQKRNTENKQNE